MIVMAIVLLAKNNKHKKGKRNRKVRKRWEKKNGM